MSFLLIWQCRVFQEHLFIDCCYVVKTSRKSKYWRNDKNTCTYYAMQTYTRNHDDYCRQMYEWHMKMQRYREQQRVYHVEQAKHFQALMGQKANVSNDSVA